MSELDETWASVLAEAESRARREGRTDIAKYLALRKSNDLLRKTGIDWLITTFQTIAGEANRRGGTIQISRADHHRFKVGNATMVGPLLTLGVRVRKLSVEAGWPRAPKDGFIRGGGLACASIKHLGLKRADEELLLIQSPHGPRWVGHDKRGRQHEIHEANLKKHVALLLGDD